MECVCDSPCSCCRKLVVVEAKLLKVRRFPEAGKERGDPGVPQTVLAEVQSRETVE